MDADGLQDAIKGMQNDPELLAAFAEAQAELEQKSAKKMKKKKKKKKGVNDQLAELEKMMAQIEEGGGDMDLETATATLAMLEGQEEKKSKKKKIKKEKFPAPFSEVQVPTAAEILKDLDINELAPEHRVALASEEFEPTPEEIEAEFQKLKAEQEAKKKIKAREKKKAEQNLLRDEDGNVLLDENGQPITMDDPELLAALLEDEDDEDMKKILQKKAKKSKKKRKGKVKKEKRDPTYEENINPDMFVDNDGFGWQKKDAEKKMFKPKSLKVTKDSSGTEPMETDTADIAETEEEAQRRIAREAGEEVAPAEAPVIDDFGPALPEHGVPARAETGAIPGGSKLKPIEDDEEIEKRLRQKALQKAIQDRLDKRLVRQKRIEVRLASWIGKQQSLKNEAKQIAEERLLRAKEITDAMQGEVAEANEQFVKDRNDIVASVRDQLRADVAAEVRREIEEEENRKIRKTERAPEAPKVPAAVMDAIQMSDAWEQFWRRYKSQLKDWSHWDEEQEEYHKQAAGWYFTQGFIQSQVVNNVPKAPDEDPVNVVDPTDPAAASAATTSAAPKLISEKSDESIPDAPSTDVPAPPTHTPEEEAERDKLEKRKNRKLEKYDALLQDPIFKPDQAPKYQPWGARDGEVRVQPGFVPAGIEEAPRGATFAPKASIPQTEKAKLARMQKMLAIVRGPQAMKNVTHGTTYLPTQDDALQFIKLERFRRDRHRFRSSDHDSETDSDDEPQQPRERGARNLPYLPKYQYGGTEELTTTSTQPSTIQATNVNQPGEMVNPAGETISASSSSDSSDSETEEQKERRLKMAAKFNPAAIYGSETVEKPSEKAGPTKTRQKIEIRRFDGRTDKTDFVGDNAADGNEFSFDFLGGGGTVSKPAQIDKKKLYNRANKVPKYLPQEDENKGPGLHKEGPLKGLSKHWKQEQGLRQRPREERKPQFVEVSEEHLPPKQLDLPEYVQDIPEAPQTAEDVKDMATMAVRDYQREHMLMERKKTRMEEYMERRKADKRFAEAPIKEVEKPENNVEVTEEDLAFDPASFFGEQTGGMFTSSKETVQKPGAAKKKATEKPKPKETPKPQELPKESQKPNYKSAGFGASWKKKPTQTTKITIKTNVEVSEKVEDPKKVDEKEELPDFLKDQEKLMAQSDNKDEEDGFGWGKKEEKKKRKGTKEKKRKIQDDADISTAPSILNESGKSKKAKKFDAAWMKRVGEDPDKPLRESAAGMEIDESELRTYNDGNPKQPSTTEEKGAGDRDDRDWGAWKPRSRQVAKDESEKRLVPRKEGELSELHKKLLNPARFDYDPDFARAGSLQFMHPLQCSKVLGRPYPEDLEHKGQKAFDDDITAYREPKPIEDPADLGPEPPPDGAIFWGVPEEVLTDPRLVVLKVGVPENCPGPEPRGWLDGLKRRKWYEKAQAPEIRPVHPASYFRKGDQLHQDKTFGVFYHPKYYGKTKEQKMSEIQQNQDSMLAESRASLAASFNQ